MRQKKIFIMVCHVMDENGVIEEKSASLFFRAKKTYSLPAQTKRKLTTVFFGLNYLAFERLDDI